MIRPSWRWHDRPTKVSIFRRTARLIGGKRPTFRHFRGSNVTYRGMTVEEIKINGDKGTPISAYTARPSGPGPSPASCWSTIFPAGARSYMRA